MFGGPLVFQMVIVFVIRQLIFYLLNFYLSNFIFSHDNDILIDFIGIRIAHLSQFDSQTLEVWVCDRFELLCELDCGVFYAVQHLLMQGNFWAW